MTIDKLRREFDRKKRATEFVKNSPLDIADRLITALEAEVALRDRMLRDIIERIALTPERWNGWTTEEVLADLRARAEAKVEELEAELSAPWHVGAFIEVDGITVGPHKAREWLRRIRELEDKLAALRADRTETFTPNGRTRMLYSVYVAGPEDPCENMTLPPTESWEEARAVAQRALDAGNDWVTIEIHQTGEAPR